MEIINNNTNPYLWILLNKNTIFLTDDNLLPYGTAKHFGFESRKIIKIDSYNNIDVCLVFFEKYDLNKKFYSLRSLIGIDYSLFKIITKAIEYNYFIETYNFCSFCGDKLFFKNIDYLFCENCHKNYFPQIKPSIIVIVRKKNNILLVKHVKRMINNIYTAIAGFIEIGESVEEAVAREVLEETGLYIDNIEYINSQSWPFPNSLMLGFIAEYKMGKINIQLDELIEAKWFNINNLPKNIPPLGTIARELINFSISYIKNNEK